MESAHVGYLGPEGSFSHEAVTTLENANLWRTRRSRTSSAR